MNVKFNRELYLITIYSPGCTCLSNGRIYTALATPLTVVIRSLLVGEITFPMAAFIDELEEAPLLGKNVDDAGEDESGLTSTRPLGSTSHSSGQFGTPSNDATADDQGFYDGDDDAEEGEDDTTDYAQSSQYRDSLIPASLKLTKDPVTGESKLVNTKPPSFSNKLEDYSDPNELRGLSAQYKSYAEGQDHIATRTNQEYDSDEDRAMYKALENSKMLNDAADRLQKVQAEAAAKKANSFTGRTRTRLSRISRSLRPS
jgi:hypothetical protein